MTRLRFRADTAANWTSVNPILAADEPGWEQDTGKLKVGDGATAWNALAYFAGGGGGGAWGTITGTLSDQADLQDALDLKLDAADFDPSDFDTAGAAAAVASDLADHEADQANPHGVTKAQVGLGNADNTSDASKPISDATQSALDLKADLVGGVIPSAQIPAIAITEYLGSVASQAAMLALVGQKGDWALRSDLGTTWIITGNDPTQLTDWTQLNYPTAPVTSVNGQTGSVTLAKGDVGLGSVTNDAQTKAAIVPNTAPGAGYLLVGNTGGTAYAPVTMSGDGVLTSGGALTVSVATALRTARTIGGISFDGSANIEPGVSTVSVTTGRALALSDRNKEIHQTHASPQTLSIPNQTTVTWVDPTTIIILAHGAGTLTLDADTGVTLNGVSGGSVALNRYQNAVLRWISSDTWVVSGTSADVA